jgi:hypothetical protein
MDIEDLAPDVEVWNGSSAARRRDVPSPMGEVEHHWMTLNIELGRQLIISRADVGVESHTCPTRA